jgi:hypothetical protein
MKYSKRRASSLIELMLLISTTTVILTLSVGFIHRTLTWSKEVTTLSDELRLNQQLALLFQHDFRDALEAEIAEDSKLKVRHEQFTIEYEILGHRITRKMILAANLPEATHSGASYQIEEFAYPPDHALRFTQDKEAKRMQLTLLHAAIDFPEPRALWTIDCYLTPSPLEAR